MLPSSFPALTLIPLVPVVVACLGFPLAERAPRRAILALGGAAWLVSLGVSAFALWAQLDRGGVKYMNEGGFTGVKLTSTVTASLGMTFTGSPVTNFVSVVVGVIGLIALVAAASSSGGGARREQRPATSAAFLTLVLTLGLVEWAVLTDGLFAHGAAHVVTSRLASAMLLSERPRERELEGALRLLVVHRLGDAAIFAALALPLASGGAAFAGLDTEALFDVETTLWLVAVASRLMPLGVPMFARDALGAQGPTLAIMHGISQFGLAALLVVRLAPTMQNYNALTAAIVVVAISMVFSALRACLTEHALRVDLHIGQVLFLLVTLAAMLGDLVTAVYGLALALVASTLLLLLAAAPIAYLRGRTSLYEMGGLDKRLRASDFARGVLTLALGLFPLSPLFILVEPLAVDAISGVHRHALVCAAVIATGLLLSFASARAFHLTYGGQSRTELKADPPRPRFSRRALIVVAALTTVVLPLVFALPAWLLRRTLPGASGALQPEYNPPFVAFLSPALKHPVGVNVVMRPIEVAMDVLGQVQLSVGLAAGALVAFLISRSLFRKAEPARTSWALTNIIERGFFLEGQIARVVSSIAFILAAAARTLVFDFILDGLLTRLTAGVTSVIRASSRLTHNGDAQRALAVILIVLAVILFGWGAT